MRIVVNHLTRMSPGNICVAGIDIVHRRHIRLEIFRSRMTTGFLRRKDGLVGIGSVLDLGPCRTCGKAPEIEDHYFRPDQVRLLAPVSPKYFWEVMQGLARNNLKEIFGDEIVKDGRTFSTPLHRGRASLGCLRLSGIPRLVISNGRLRMRIQDGHESTIAVTDLRLYEDDQQTPKAALVRETQRMIKGGEELILSVGLTRPFAKGEGEEKKHWLQINNIHLREHLIQR